MKQIIIKTTDRLITFLLYTVIILFLSSFDIQDNPPSSGWYQQWLPDLNGSTIKSMTFIDSLTGFAVTNPGTGIYCYILKTTNGGDNWEINYKYNSGSNIWFTKIQFADNDIGYASTNFFTFFKTTNTGLNWIELSTPWGAQDMAVIKKDTILIVPSDGLGGGVYRSTNGGLSWQLIWTAGLSGNPSRIYMYDKNMGFSSGEFPSLRFRKTTNGGFNWFGISDTSFSDIKFIDTLIGYKVEAAKRIKKSTDAGITWLRQIPPNGTELSGSSLSVFNKDTAWFVGPMISQWGIICKTTNGGLNWGYQLPDTSIHIWFYSYLNFINQKFGWAYASYINTGVHTTSGGSDTTFYTDINNNITSVPDNYVLEQNYPNPFNSITNVKFKMLNEGFATLKVYDIRGREVAILVNKELEPGTYQVRFDAVNLTSGIYFYQLEVNPDKKNRDAKSAQLDSHGRFSTVKKMLLVK